MKRDFPEPEQGWPEWSDFIITICSAFVSLTLNLILNYFTWNYFYSICKEKNDEEIRIAKTKKACNSLFKFFYFMTVTFWGYTILKDEPYLPKWLGGHGDFDNIHADYP